MSFHTFCKFFISVNRSLFSQPKTDRLKQPYTFSVLFMEKSSSTPVVSTNVAGLGTTYDLTSETFLCFDRLTHTCDFCDNHVRHMNSKFRFISEFPRRECPGTQPFAKPATARKVKVHLPEPHGTEQLYTLSTLSRYHQYTIAQSCLSICLDVLLLNLCADLDLDYPFKAYRSRDAPTV